MFEAKVDERIQNLAKTGTDNDKKFLEDARKEEICSVIDSLSDDDFISLQKSIMESFDAVQVLFDIVKGEMEHGNTSFTNIFLAVNAAYLESSERSFYFKSEYVRLLSFLNEVRCDSGVKEEKLLEKFRETIERPFCSTRDEILKAIFTRNELKERVVLDTQIQEVQKLNMLNELCEKIRKMVLDNMEDEKLTESLREISPSQIRDCLIIPICNLKDYYLATPFYDNYISPVLDKRKKCTEECNTNYEMNHFTISNTMGLLNSRWLKLSKYDNALEHLIEELQDISAEVFNHELNILQQVKDSSKRIRRKFYSGKKFTYKSMKGINYNDTYLESVRDSIFKTLREFKNKLIENINTKAIDDINLEVLKFEKQGPYAKGEIQYTYEKKLNYVSIDEIMEDMQRMREYADLQGIFFKFFVGIASDESKERFISEFDQTKNIYNKDAEEIMKSIAQTIWNTPEIKHLIGSSDDDQLLDFYGHQLDLYSQFLNKRSIGEDDVIDAVIGVKPSVYQKGYID